MAFVNETQELYKPPSTLRGAEAIKAALKTIPNAPGVYRMLDEKGTALYVGKAKNLTNRVGSYASSRDLSTRIMRMVEQVAAVEVITTQSEAEALLVEASNIKRLKPRYNVLLKDDKSFPYLHIDTTHPYPRIEKHRGAQNKPGQYYGPFASVGALNETMVILQKMFLVRPCSDTYFKNRTRPCLQYQIKRCSAPCVKYISQEAYGEQLTHARDFLRGRHRDVQEALAGEMRAASEAQDYERAANLRDRIRDLTRVQQEQQLNNVGLEDADVFALATRGGKSVVHAVFFRRGVHFGNQSFHPKHSSDTPAAEIMAGFLGQFYDAHTPPGEILVNLMPDEASLLADALAMKSEAKVDIYQPLRGDKLTLILQAYKNAEAALMREALEHEAVKTHLASLQQLFGLPRPPQRIEVYDNSHTMGRQAIGAFIVATPEGFDKKSYRTYNIRDLETVPGDDYAMMREVFSRRFKNAAEGASPAPDLVLIDGGKGQLSSVEEALEKMGVQGPALPALVAIAKGQDRNAGREWFFMPGREPFQLPVNDPTLHYLQRLRDEAHRFAIGRHRKKRSGALTVSALDDIPGIGPGRKKALLNHFGSRAEVERATLDALTKVPGINKTTAKNIYDYFHG